MAESREHHQQRHPTENIKSLIQEKSPSATQALSVATLLPLGGILLALTGITLTGTVIGLAVATPLFVIFSPVLVPAAIVIGLAVTGFLVSGAFGLTGLTSLTWIAKPTSVLLPKNKTIAMAESREHHQQRHPTEIIKSLIQEKSPSATQALSVATLLPLGGILLALAGITLTGTLISLAVATPLFVIFSPVLVPAAIVIGLAVTGFLASGAFGLTSLTWIANYLRGARTKVPEQTDYIYMKRKMADAEGQVGQGIQNKAQG